VIDFILIHVLEGFFDYLFYRSTKSIWLFMMKVFPKLGPLEDQTYWLIGIFSSTFLIVVISLILFYK
jgi:hypothetical protein